jgi:TIR domain
MRSVRFFVSYVRSDEASHTFALTLAKTLEERGHDVFVDVINLDVGAPWEEVLERQIVSCDAMVLLISERIAESYVKRELELAAARNRREGRPRVMPVRMNFRGSLGEELDATLNALHYLVWNGDADTLETIARIERSGRAAVRSPWPRIAAVTAAVALLAALFAWSVILLRVFDGDDPRAARRAHERLRLLERLVVPNAWLVGSWDPDRAAEAFCARRASAIENAAKAKWAMPRRRDADDGLLLAALAGLVRGSAPPAEAIVRYDAQHYGKLVATLRDPLELAGRSLAVLPGTPFLIAEEGRVWTCDGQWNCSVTPPLIASAVREAAFVSPSQLVAVTDAGAVQINLATGKIAALDADATSVAEALGVFAGTYRPPWARRAQRVVFGPCASCVSVLADGAVSVRDRENGRTSHVADRARAMDANGRALAVVWSDARVTFYDARLTVVAQPHVQNVDVDRLRAISLAGSGTEAALTHDGIVTIVSVAAESWRLVDETKEPGVVAAVYAGDLLVTRTFNDVRIWNPHAASVRQQPDPAALWVKWRKQLGLGINAAGEVVPGSRGAPQLGWNRVRRRIEEYH